MKPYSTGLYYRMAEIVTLSCVWLYGILRTLPAALRGDPAWVVTGIASAMPGVIVTILVAGRFSTDAKAFLIPATILSFLLVAPFFTGIATPVFTVYLCAAVVSAMYLRPKSFLLFWLFSNIVQVLVLFVFVPRPFAAEFTFNNTVTNMVVCNLGMAVLYSICRFAGQQLRNIAEFSDSMSTMMATTPSLTLFVDSECKVTNASKSFLSMQGINSLSEIQGKELASLFTVPELQECVTRGMHSTGLFEETLAIDQENGRRWLKIFSREKADGSGGRFFDASDITPLVEARLQAEESSRAKSGFLANMSHEIRTPMNAIIGMTDILCASKLEPQQQLYAENIKSASVSLLKIINDILDFSKIDAAKMEIAEQPFDFASMIYDVSSVAGINVSKKNLTFVVDISKDIPAIVCADELRLKQILTNLLNNAIKFTNEGFVKLVINGAQQPDGRLRLEFSVQDSGIGIKQEDFNKLFVEYEQLDTKKNKKIIGTGLGMAISRRLVELMGGEIKFLSVYGKGSTFFFYITCPMEDATPIAHVDNPEGKRVLLFEPNPHYGKAIVKMCANLGVECLWAETEEEFIVRHLDEQFSAELFDFCHSEKIRNACHTGFVSGNAVAMHSIADAMDLDLLPPGVGYIEKPLFITSLAQIINRTFSAGQIPGQRSDHHLGSFKTRDVKALLVDDNLTNLKVAATLLKHYNISADECESGMDALAAVSSNHYDIVFMDHMMPEMDGLDTTAAIRALGGEYARLPIIALSANALVGMREIFITGGMNDFLPKPIEIKNLNYILRAYLPAEKIVELAENTPENKETPTMETPEPAKIPAARLPEIDMEKGRARIGGKAEDYLGILKSFAGIAHKKIHAIREYFAADNFYQLKIEVHGIKSSLLAIGADNLSNQAKELELALHENDYAFVRQGMQDFYERLQSLHSRLVEMMEELEARDADAPKNYRAQGDKESLLNLLRKAEAALRQYEHTEAVDALEGLRALTFSPEIDAKLKEAYRLLTAFQTEDALFACQAILRELE